MQSTQYAGHATLLAQEAAQAGHALVMAAGGDGTLSEVANGLVHTDTILAPLPAGTANSFAKELNIPRFTPLTAELWSSLMLNGHVQQMDVGEQNSHYWLFWSGVGIDGYMVHAVEPRPSWSKRLGRFGYLLQTLPKIAHLPLMEGEVTIDGRSYTDCFTLVLISNCRRYLGSMVTMSPQAVLDDGQFEVWLCQGRTARQAIKQIFMAGLKQHERRQDMQMVNGRQITIHTTHPILCQIDGNPAPPTPIEVTLHPRALRVLVPQTAPKALFRQQGKPL